MIIKGRRELAARRRRLTSPQKWIVILGLLTLILGLGNLARAVVALRHNATLSDLPPTVPLTYLAAMGSFWGLVFIFGTVGLVRFRPWGRWLILAAVTLFETHVWLNHFLLDASDAALQTRPWDLLLTLLLLALVWASLNLRNVRKVFSQESSRKKQKEREAR